MWRMNNNRNGSRNNSGNNFGAARPAMFNGARGGGATMRLQQMLTRAQQANQPQQNHQNQQAPPFSEQQQHGRQRGQAQQQQPYFDPSVTYEPLSEDMLKLMGANQPAEQPQPPLPQAPPPIPKDLFTNPYPPPSGVNATAEQISALMQDEQNGAAFYRHLAGRQTNGAAKQILERIATDNENRVAVLGQIYKAGTGKDFGVTKTGVTFDADLRTCLKMAAAEENAVIGKLIGLIETDKNDKLTYMLYRKLNNVNLLLSL